MDRELLTINYLASINTYLYNRNTQLTLDDVKSIDMANNNINEFVHIANSYITYVLISHKNPQT